MTFRELEARERRLSGADEVYPVARARMPGQIRISLLRCVSNDTGLSWREDQVRVVYRMIVAVGDNVAASLITHTTWRDK